MKTRGEGRQKICDALLKLMSKSKVEDITVKEIVQEAQVSRTTFYYHFEQISDVLEAIMDDLVRPFYQVNVSYDTIDGREDPRGHFGAIVKALPMYEFIYANRWVYKALFQSEYYIKFREKIAQAFKRAIQSYNYYFETEDGRVYTMGNTEFEYWVWCAISKVIAILEIWSERDFAETPEELIEIAAYLDGIISFHSMEKGGSWPRLQDVPVLQHDKLKKRE